MIERAQHNLGVSQFLSIRRKADICLPVMDDVVQGLPVIRHHHTPHPGRIIGDDGQKWVQHTRVPEAEEPDAAIILHRQLREPSQMLSLRSKRGIRLDQQAGADRPVPREEFTIK